MSKKIEKTFKVGDKVTACPEAMKNGNKAGKLMSHTGLSAEELVAPMYVTGITASGQIEVKHERLSLPVTIHTKFMTRHSDALPTDSAPQ